MHYEYIIIGFFSSWWFLQWCENGPAEAVAQDREIRQSTETQTDLTAKQIKLLIQQWEQVAQWAQKEGIDVNQKWNLATLRIKVQEREKELMVDLSQKFNERLAQEKAKITELSNQVSKWEKIEVGEIWKREVANCPSSWTDKVKEIMEGWEKELGGYQNEPEKVGYLVRSLGWTCLAAENFKKENQFWWESQLERLRMKTASSQERQEILDKTRNNIEQKKAQLTAMTELINLDPEPQREEFSNDTEYSQALAAWKERNKKS